MRTLLVSFLLTIAALPLNAEPTAPAERIATQIGAGIAERIPISGRYRVTLADPSVLPAAETNFTIAALNYDPARQNFWATLSFTGQGGTEYVRLTGSAIPVIDVPALSHDVALGETVNVADLTTIELPLERASAALLTSSAVIAGQAAKRALRARTALFAYDLKKPILVKKGELVSVVYALPGIELTTQGQVQADAGKGDTVSVLNTRSRRTIEARVTAAGTVTVSAPASTIAAN